MNNSVFGKTMENVRNYRDIRIVTTRRSIPASEPNYHSTKYISKDLLIMELKKTEVRMHIYRTSNIYRTRTTNIYRTSNTRS